MMTTVMMMKIQLMTAEMILTTAMTSDTVCGGKTTAVIIAAAGSSTRMGGTVKKEYLPLKNGTVLSECAKVFLSTLSVKYVVITVPCGGSGEAQKALFADDALKPLLRTVNLSFVEGGSTRQKSILNALEFLAETDCPPDIVLIHDGARPFVTGEIILRTAEAAAEFGAAVPGIPPVDTQKTVGEDGFISVHLRRASMTAVQTPQGFLFPKLLEAHRKAAGDDVEYTDDTEIWDKYEGKVKVVEGNACNKKITYAHDYSARTDTGKDGMILRTGLGYDLHRLTAGRKLVIGGIDIPFEKGEDGHSDGDALLHAITDALLGASGLGDIGSFFPPEEAQWKDADSSVLLQTVWKKIQAEGWKLNNLDCVIKLEKPKFLPYRNQVISSVAETLGVSTEQVFVKAKTGEKLGSVGNGEVIEVWCSCILTK
ncbi:MAG: 2-C-methyl-D-erythritol 2,4-cyclodiphosphate synthase [Treponema porcinum]|uniref:2-C-methyl-D-erythritol 2,4-cyclodiphosphate synthase n=1 Tax=Treponema porcinum TaxID=261392 RepID=UPI002354773B|nr:2-C-methyl-D-erythritol 2,4-cyclodiphosphate synthase [Treponema porcinum]MCI7546148.1 2-C-methyl-D-erythritol 2,4-cyclodiphosphate synthase [Treponema porcinum]MDY4189730.1 2-C-methyl-D-erythritol 2,4-cyclodiphosphate synthase [Treponema porcinum]MDY5047333.1 2-C-methyl-D-erythritol 2,4-cyclodiphosphate synthase [Treponema porcinum]MDY5048349.1 2-C-methyl-D-erythritol 2,4-cyclodiphosphate synthase [Treponema porcinum]